MKTTKTKTMATAGRSGSISLEDAVHYKLENDCSVIDSSQGGLSSDEEEKIGWPIVGYWLRLGRLR